ncbi:Uncharacterized protein RDABS01_027494 [Bienertia sinuspersici]
MILWSIWNARNKLVFEDELTEPEVCVNKAVDILQEYRNAVLEPRRSTLRYASKWCPPCTDEIKVNFDAAVDETLGGIGVGLVARNSEGEVVLAKAVHLPYRWTTEVGEARAALEAIKVAKECEWDRVVIEGDAQVIINALQRGTMRSSHAQIWTDDALALSSAFTSLSFNVCFRDCKLPTA